MPLPNETAEEYEIPTIVDIIKKQLKAPKKNIAKLFIYAPPFCMVATDMDTNVCAMLTCRYFRHVALRPRSMALL